MNTSCSCAVTRREGEGLWTTKGIFSPLRLSPLSLNLEWAEVGDPQPASILGINEVGHSIDCDVLYRHMWVRHPNSMAMAQVLKSWALALSLPRPAVKAQAQHKKTKTTVIINER